MRIDIVSHRTTQPPHCAEMLEGEHAAVRAEELSLGLGSGHRGIRVFGHLIHFIVNKYLLNFSIYSQTGPVYGSRDCKHSKRWSLLQ